MNFTQLTKIDKASLARIPGVYWLYDFFRLMLVPSFRKDGMSTAHNTDFMNKPRFKKAYATALKQEKMSFMHWRMHTVLWAAQQALHLEGDFVECGVNRGFLSAAVMDYVDFKTQAHRKFYLFDTYQGFVASQVTDKDKTTFRKLYPDCYQFVVDSFREYPNVVVVRGAVPGTLANVQIDKVAYFSLDMNCVEPELAALAFFWPKMVKGGVIVLDDYAYTGHGPQKESADKFALSVGTEIMSLPTGQGLLIKT